MVRCSGQCWSLCHVKHAVGERERSLGQNLCERCAHVANVHISSDSIRWLPDIRLDPSSVDEEHFASRALRSRLERYITHDFLLTKRKRVSDLSASDHSEIAATVVDAVLIHSQVKRIVKTERVTRIFYYNDVYAVNLIVKDIADELGIQTVNLNLGVIPYRMHDRYSVSSSQENLLADQRSPRACPPLHRRQCREVKKAIRFQLYGRSPFLYSTPSRKRGQKGSSGIADCVLILSSHDEMQSLKYLFPETFKDANYDQTASVAWFIRLAEQFPEKSFVVRPHPREFRNHRHSSDAAHSKYIFQQLSHLPANVTVDWPEMKVPMFDRIRSSHSVLFTWSSAGLDALALGKRVACTTPADLTWCPSELFTTIAGFEELVDFFEASIHGPPDSNRQLQAVRWYGWFLSATYGKFCWIPFRWSPGRLLQGVSGRSGFFFRRLSLFSRRIEGSFSRYVELSTEHFHSQFPTAQEQANNLERRLCSKLRSF